MKTGASLKNRQGGAVAVMVGISMVVLIGFLAMVIDLGRLYVAKAGLQNAADAAALAGVKQLNGTKLGVDGAVQWAIAAAAKNNYDLSSLPVSVDDDDIDIWVGTCPEDSCMAAASDIATDTDAVNRNFLKVHTRSRNLVTWFAPIWNIFNVSTYGVAVAGPLEVNVSPMAVCAIDVDASATPHVCKGPGNECGFLRGVAYNLPSLNPISNGDPIWINPVDSYPGSCAPNNGSTPILAPFVCAGKVKSRISIPGEVWVNTGTQSVMNDPLNSRFSVPSAYSGGHACNPATAPGDINVKEYMWNPGPLPGGGCPPDSTNPNCGHPRDWMEPANDTTPTQQGITIDSATRKPLNYPARPAGFDQWGALWSYAQELNQATSSVWGLSDWPTLYGGSAVPSTSDGYPASGVPYTQTSGKYFKAPTGVGATYKKANRRVLNVVLIDCTVASSITGAICNAHLPVLGVGQFFMQRQGNLPNEVFGEFAGILPAAQINKPRYVLVK